MQTIVWNEECWNDVLDTWAGWVGREQIMFFTVWNEWIKKSCSRKVFVSQDLFKPFCCPSHFEWVHFFSGIIQMFRALFFLDILKQSWLFWSMTYINVMHVEGWDGWGRGLFFFQGIFQNKFFTFFLIKRFFLFFEREMKSAGLNWFFFVSRYFFMFPHVFSQTKQEGDQGQKVF